MEADGLPHDRLLERARYFLNDKGQNICVRGIGIRHLVIIYDKSGGVAWQRNGFQRSVHNRSVPYSPGPISYATVLRWSWSESAVLGTPERRC